MKVHVLIEFDAELEEDHDTQLQIWRDFRGALKEVLPHIFKSVDKFSLTHSSGNREMDEMLRKAEQASEALVQMVEILKKVEPDRRMQLIKMLEYKGGRR